MTKQRSKGRRVSKSLAVSYPRVQEIAEVAKKLGLKYEVRVDAAHPSAPIERVGLIVVKKTDKKTTILKSIAKEIRSLRGVEKAKKETQTLRKV